MTDNQFNQLFDLVTKSVSGIQRLERGQEEMRADISELKTDVSGLKTDIAELKTDVSGLKTDVAELKTDVSGLKTDVAELKEGQARHDKGLQILNRTLTNMHGDLGNLRSRVEILEDERNLAVK